MPKRLPLDRLKGPFKKGQPVWVYVNGEPGLRYYVRPHDRSHILAFAPDLEHPVLYEHSILWPSKAAILNWMIEGLESRMEDLVETLIKRRKEFAAEYQ